LGGLPLRDQETVVATIEGLAFMNRPSREPGWMGEDQVMNKAVGRDGAGRVPRPKGEGERDCILISSLSLPTQNGREPKIFIDFCDRLLYRITYILSMEILS
jgi:hypothetical protein